MKKTAPLVFAAALAMAAGAFAKLTELPAEEATAQIEAWVQKKKATKDIVSDLSSALQNADTAITVKERAAWALGELQAASAVPTLLKAAEHKGLLVRSAALGSLIRLRSRSALPTLVKIAENDPILSLREKAVVGLGLLSWEKTIPTLVKLASDPAPEVRGAVALAMGATQSSKNDFTEALAQMESDENPFVQTRAQKALAAAKRKNKAILDHLDADDSDVRLFAALYFRQHGTGQDLKRVSAQLNGEADDDVRYELESAVKSIKKRAAAAKKKPT